MNDAEILSDAIGRFGPQLAAEPNRLRAVLADLGMEGRSVFALLAAVDDGVPGALQTSSQPTGSLDRTARLADGLVARHALDPTMAAWAVSAWAHALGVAPGGWSVEPGPPHPGIGQETVVAPEPVPSVRPGPVGPWAPGPQPPPPQPGRTGRGGLIALVAGLGVVLVVAGGAGAWVGYQRLVDTTVFTTDDESSTTTEEESPSTTEETTGVTPSVESLRQQARAKGYSTCVGDPAVFANQSSGVRCTGSVPPNTYAIFTFSTASRLDDAYATVVDKLRPLTQTMCAQGPANGSWYDNNKVTRGKLLCVQATTFDTQSRVQAVWTDSRDLTLRYIYVPDTTTYPSLFSRWQVVVD